MDKKLSTFSFGEDSIAAGGHPLVLIGHTVNAAQGDLIAGLLLGKSATSLVPWDEATEVIDTGDGATKAYSGTIAHYPIQPGTLVITDGVETFADDGLGRLTGDAGGSGTIVYATGAYDLSFNANVVNLTDIEATNYNELACVNEGLVDTTAETSCNGVVHGSVRADRLTKGATPVALSVADYARLIGMSIYPV